MSSPSPRRSSFALAATLAVWAATWTPLAPPSATAQDAAEVRDAVGEVTGLDAASDDAGPARPSTPREQKQTIAEAAWYLFFVTAAALFGLVTVVWAFGWYKRTFLEDEPLQTELFDAATRAEIERHRKEVQAEQEAAKRAAEAETVDVGKETVAAGDIELPNDETADETADDEAPANAGAALAGQTGAPPDPAVQPDAASPDSAKSRGTDVS